MRGGRVGEAVRDACEGKDWRVGNVEEEQEKA